MIVELNADDFAEYEKLQREGIDAMREGEHEIANDRLAKVWSFLALASMKLDAEIPQSLKA